jgi:ADP-ribose pyrophosphatase YjhB (NUDIX family)
MSNNDETRRPSVGVATVVVDKQGRVLVGKDTRKGDAVYGVPGGHWESGETLKDCAIREVREESGVTCSTVQLISVYDFYRADKEKSYVSIGMKALYVAGELTSKEDEGRLEWGWYSVDEALNLNLFPPDKVLLERYKSGVIYE